MINGTMVYADQEYDLREVADILGVTYQMVRQFYVHEYGLLVPRMKNPRYGVVDGDQIIYFAENKSELLKKRKVNQHEQRLAEVRSQSQAEGEETD